MISTAIYYRQHDDLLNLAGRLSEGADLATTPEGVAAVLDTLAEMTSNLLAHLELEDDHLYPALMCDDDPTVAELAQTYVAEMGGIRDLYVMYVDRWNARIIASDHARFVRETAMLIAGLADRIERENEVLYPLMAARARSAA